MVASCCMVKLNSEDTDKSGISEVSAMAEGTDVLTNDLPEPVVDQDDATDTQPKEIVSNRGEPLPITVARRIAKAQELKQEGNAFFKQQEWKKAIRKYHHVIMYAKGIIDKFDLIPGLERAGGRLKPTDEETKTANELMAAVSNNLAACLIKTEEWDKIFKHTNKVIELQPENAKAHFRRGVANLNLGKLDNATDDLKRAETLDSKDLGIKKQLQLLQQRQADYRKSEQKMYSAMFKS